MLKKLILATALVAGSAIAQENTDISGANFQSGKADGTLAALGRKAAASGHRLVITAPPEWHAKIAAKVKAGGAADVVLRDGFYENVLVRVESKAEAAAAAKPAEDRSKVEAEKAKAEAEKARADAERMKAEAEKAKAEAEAAKSRADAEKARADAEAARARAEAEKAEQAKRAAAAAAAAPEPAPAAPVAKAPAAPASKGAAAAPPAASGDDATRERMEKSLNEGHAARGDMPVGRLQSGDVIYVDGAVRGVVRREGNRSILYWLDGDLDLRRMELKPLAPNRYQVLSGIHGEPTLRREFATATVDAAEPAANAPARAALEKSINEGRSIEATIEPSKLRNGDVLYVSGTAVAVVRRSGSDLVRYWLVGSLDLQQPGLQADGTNKYKVLGDTLR